MWQELKDKNNNVYYHNTETNETSWQKPTEVTNTLLETALNNTNHLQFKSKENDRFYYYNKLDKTSVWELPDVVKVELKRLEEMAETEKKADAQEPDSDLKMSAHDIDYSKYKNNSVLLQSRSQLDNESEFIEMLREIGVDSTWSFSKIIDRCINDKRYWLIKDSLKKRQIFENYLNNRSKEELLKENDSLENFNTAFVNLLKSLDSINYYTTWRTAKFLIKDEPIYSHSVVSEKVKKQTFQKYVNSLREQHEDLEQKQKAQALSELTDYFNLILKISINSKWEEIYYDRLLDDTRFKQNKHFQHLTKLDILELYHKQLLQHQDAQVDRIKIRVKQNYRSDRKARDSFRELLAELKDTGLINANTIWSEIFPLIETDDRFIGLIDRNGSTPVDLFNDYVNNEELILKGEKNYVEQLLIHKGISINNDLTKEKFKEVLLSEKDAHGKIRNEDDVVELIWERIQKDLEEQRERESKAIEGKFYGFLKSLDFISFESIWEEVYQKITTENLEPNDLGFEKLSDNTKKDLFNEFISNLKYQESLKVQNIHKRSINAILGNPLPNNGVKRVREDRAIEKAVELDY